MLRPLMLCALLALAAPARAQDGPAGVIRDQLDAFTAGDVATAFTFASPTIRRLFGTPDRFGSMVAQGYPMVWNPGEVRFLDAREQGGAVFQEVLILDAGGVPHVLEYMMIPGADGWQINGVRILEAPPVGA